MGFTGATTTPSARSVVVWNVHDVLDQRTKRTRAWSWSLALTTPARLAALAGGADIAVGWGHAGVKSLGALQAPPWDAVAPQNEGHLGCPGFGHRL
jgi:hypothetical protein